jgi:hypothetical protein
MVTDLVTAKNAKKINPSVYWGFGGFLVTSAGFKPATF